jgi:hypothetical protein
MLGSEILSPVDWEGIFAGVIHNGKVNKAQKFA